MNNKLALLIPVLTVALGVSVYSVAGVKKKAPDTDIPAGFQMKTVESLLVQTEHRNKIYQSACMIAPQNIYHLAPKVEGEVVYVRKGGHQVKKGELLLEIENDSVRYHYQVAQNNLRLNELNLKRYRSLRVKNSKQETDELQLKVDNLRAEVAYQRSLFESFKFYAPEDGVFETPSVKQYDRVNPGVSVLTFYGNQTFEFTSKIPLHIFSSIALRDEIALRSVDNGDVIATAQYSHHEPEDNGEFVTLYGTLSPDDVMMESTGTPANLVNHSLFERCTSNLPLQRADQGIFLENKYVHLDYKGFYVFKLDGRRVKKNYVQVSWYDDGVLELESGVSEGDRIATAGSFKLLDNELVRVKRPQLAPKTPSMSDAEPTEQLVGMIR
ncbi:efflux RND transporter periplasmic adaptor subunit [Enterovibrio norvegicus]|uniref:efflux RND transporter periplasmic adaptor subunit n=1 Tax=Enterovibrio norvegicus TaxID=188144 RepID=UPI000C8163A3|nr:secretion protein HlyD [Enterovibrio norvegicus]PMN70595.1 secretion protein HlyD [Enterovibrio norvegicus]